MTRIKTLWKANPRRLLLAFGALMIAAALAVGSGASFNSTSANPSNVFSAGTLSQTNNKTNAAILSASNMKPGDTATGTVDIKNTGSVPGTFSLARTSLTDNPVSPAFSGQLNLVITDNGDPTCVTSCPAAVQKYSGTLAAMGTIAMGTYAANENHRYTFAVTFPNGTPAVDNTFQQASTTAGYTWTSGS